MRNPKRTNWDSFQKDLAISPKNFPKRFGSTAEIELCVDHLQRGLTAMRRTVQLKQFQIPEILPGGTLNCRSSAARKSWNRNTGRQSDWDLYKRAQKDYRVVL